MKWSLKLGRLWGVDVYLHYTFLVFLALVGLDSRLQTGRWAPAVSGVSMFLGVFVCVLLHEYGHAMAARRYGVVTRDITLLPMGGVARLDKIPEAPLQQLVIALAGPLVNVVIAVGLGLGLRFSDEMPGSLRELESSGFFPRLLLINAGLVAFNLLPAFPMDGGRVLRALLALWIDPVRATRISAGVGRVMAVLFIGAAFLMSSPMLGIIGVFVWMEAGGEAISAEMRAAMGDATVRRVMLRRFRVLTPADPLSRVAEWLIEDSQGEFPVVDDDGQVLGVVTRSGLFEGLRRGGESSAVEGIVQRDVALLGPDEALEAAMLRLEESGLPVALVVEGGRLVGMLTSENAAEFIALQRALRRERVPPVLVAHPRGIVRILPWILCAVPLSLQAETDEVPRDSLVVRRLEWIPQLRPRLIPALLPTLYSVVAVEDLVAARGSVWASVRSWGDTNLAPGRGRLWSYVDNLGRFEPVRGPVEPHAVNALMADSRRLWLGLDGGVASIDFETGVTQPYGPAQGFVTSEVAGFAESEGTVATLGRFGTLWFLPPGAQTFARASESASSEDPREPKPWLDFTSSKEWMGTVSESLASFRHRQAQHWIPFSSEFANGNPRTDRLRLRCIEGDGAGGFWLGSDAGLHWLHPADNIVENRFAPVQVLVSGGLGTPVTPGFRPTKAAQAAARQRVLGQIRDRMRDRASRARENLSLKYRVDPVTPSSRLPGGVTALLRDGPWLWVGTLDGTITNRGRVLLMHHPTRRWVGWFPVGGPVVSMAAEPGRLWMGLDVAGSRGVSALLVADRTPLVSMPQDRWVRDAILPEELGEKLAMMPVRERAVLAFFAGQSDRVVDLLAPGHQVPDDLDAEGLFLLAFAHDLIGLNQPERLDEYLDLLRTRHPASVFAELAGGIRSARTAERVESESAAETSDAPAPAGELPPVAPADPRRSAAASPTVETAVPVPVPAPPPASPSPAGAAAPVPASLGTLTDPERLRVAAVVRKRDLNRDGKLNLIEVRLWLGPAVDWPSIDVDGSGDLGPSEILNVIVREDAKAEAGAKTPGAPAGVPEK